MVGPRRATTRTVSPGSSSSRSPATTRPSALATTLLVTATIVAVGEVDEGQQQGDEVVAGGHLRHPVGGVRRHLRHVSDTSRTAAAAIAAVASWSVIISGTAAHAMPVRAHPVHGVGVALVDQPAVEDAAGRPGAVVEPDRRRR